MSDVSSLPDTAPAEYVYCPRCATRLVTRPVSDRPRRACPACGFIYFTDPKVGVGILVLRAGKVLLVKRAMEPERGKWSLPAGFLDRGEDPAATAIREVREETGLEVAIDHLLDVYYNPPQGQIGASVFILYQGRVTGGELAAGDDAEAAGFFGLDELPDIAFRSTVDAVRRLRDREAPNR